MLDPALGELDVLGSRLALVLSDKRQHIVGHVEAVGLCPKGRHDGPRAVRRSRRPNQDRGPLAFFESCERGWIAAAERRQHSSSGSDPVSSSAKDAASGLHSAL
jgi:hypothetical protein